MTTNLSVGSYGRRSRWGRLRGRPARTLSRRNVAWRPPSTGRRRSAGKALVLMRKQRKLVIAAALAACALVGRSSYAVEPFTLVHDAYPEPVGQGELEFKQAAFWHPKEDHNPREYGTEFELERGITDKLALSVFGEISYQDNAEKEGLGFEQ